MLSIEIPQHPARRLLAVARQCLSVALLAASAATPVALARNPDLELDRISDAQLDALLQAELDWDDLAACGLQNPRAAVPDDALVDIIECALSDEGDDDSESDLDWDDLEYEMNEAGTSIDQVVRMAVQQADAAARAPTPGPDRRLVAVAGEAGAEAPDARPADAVLELAARNGYVDPASVSVRYVKAGIRSAVHAVVR